MKNILLSLLIITEFNLKALGNKLTKLWETENIIDLPESVLFDSDMNILYAI